jgi:hypothetical protein
MQFVPYLWDAHRFLFGVGLFEEFLILMIPLADFSKEKSKETVISFF